MFVFDLMIFAKFNCLKLRKEEIINNLKSLANKIVIFCVFSEYELIVDLFDCMNENIIIVFPVYTLSDYCNIFNSFLQTDIYTSVDYYIIITNDVDLKYGIDNISRLTYLSETNGVIKLSHCVQNKDIYCLSYDIFFTLFKNIILRTTTSSSSSSISSYSPTIGSFKDFLVTWAIFEL